MDHHNTQTGHRNMLWEVEGQSRMRVVLQMRVHAQWPCLRSTIKYQSIEYLEGLVFWYLGAQMIMWRTNVEGKWGDMTEGMYHTKLAWGLTGPRFYPLHQQPCLMCLIIEELMLTAESKALRLEDGDRVQVCGSNCPVRKWSQVVSDCSASRWSIVREGYQSYRCTQ